MGIDLLDLDHYIGLSELLFSILCPGDVRLEDSKQEDDFTGVCADLSIVRYLDKKGI